MFSRNALTENFPVNNAPAAMLELPKYFMALGDLRRGAPFHLQVADVGKAIVLVSLVFPEYVHVAFPRPLIASRSTLCRP